jgi:hypothetical protein
VSIDPIKQALRADLQGSVVGIGTIDLARIDPDDLPRRWGSSNRQGVNPGAYWALTLQQLADAPAGWGSGPGAVNLFRVYQLRLEGWLGIRAVEEQTARWEALVESLCDRLEACAPALAQAIDGDTLGLLSVQRLSAAIDVVRLGTNSRFHHAVVTAQVETYRRIA